ncbi:hypothetical protein SH591_08705 [Sphingomonas sp. LY54]|uniref:hypothetical protein n=1 Tax=Sphingomonas sp. LY54 TaxID=3095343 RepID=UPI002D76B948|nr:hypothetical protein [Sphingomonas sp. LY54]WRP27203.1 hypothetical protein SH591_08705 [Sphingomonas sp. LY54]
MTGGLNDNDTLDLFPNHPGFKEQGGTSEDAAKLAAETAPMLRERCFDLIQASPTGLTGDEVAERLGWGICSIRARCSELYAMGWVRKYGRRANRHSRASSVVWKAVPAGERESVAAHVKAEAKRRASARAALVAEAA